jgi:hypothetical protein
MKVERESVSVVRESQERCNRLALVCDDAARAVATPPRFLLKRCQSWLSTLTRTKLRDENNQAGYLLQYVYIKRRKHCKCRHVLLPLNVNKVCAKKALVINLRRHNVK